jgi:hypothetical protein
MVVTTHTAESSHESHHYGRYVFLCAPRSRRQTGCRAATSSGRRPTSTFASLYLRPIDELSIQVGLDNRRNVRLYRDYVNPVTAADVNIGRSWYFLLSATRDNAGPDGTNLLYCSISFRF